jgi:hypothetical protein
MPSSPRPRPFGAALALALLACTVFPLPASAHHSFAAVFEMNTTREIEGQVTKVLWTNPHIKVFITAADGQNWEIEAGPVNLLSRMDIDKSTLKVGETIRAYGNPGKRNTRTLWVSNILLPNQVELLAAPDVKPHWPKTRTIGETDRFTRPGKPAADGRVSFYRVWSSLIPMFPRPAGAPVLTEAGERAQARYDISRKAVGDCEVPGMPFAMMSPYPIEIIQQGDRLQIRGEAYDLRRVAYLAAPAKPPAPSPLGLSVARISGNVLTIETSGIAYHSYGDLGPAQSDQSRVVERFTLSADGLTLDYDLTITDPVMLAKPWSWSGKFHAWEGARLEGWDACQER